MKVVHLCSLDSGGRGISTAKLHSGLLGRGVESSILALNLSRNYLEEERVYQVGRDLYPRNSSRIASRIKELSCLREALSMLNRDNHEAFNSSVGLFDPWQFDLVQEADIIHVNGLDGFIDLDSLVVAEPKGRIVFTLSDMSLFTGGCVYSLGCTRFIESCGRCYQLTSLEENDLSREIWRDKSGIISKSSISLIAPSKWMLNLAQQSSILEGQSFHLIPNGIDLGQFNPGDRLLARREFGLDEDAKIVLVASEYPTRRRDFGSVVEALEKLKDRVENLQILRLGRYLPNEYPEYLPIKNIEYLNREEDLVRFYRSGDVFLNISKQESFGIMSLGAMACGTPVSGYCTLGILDALDPESSDLLVEYGDNFGLEDRLYRLLSDVAYHKKMSNLAYWQAAENFSIEKEVNSHVELYSKLILSK